MGSHTCPVCLVAWECHTGSDLDPGQCTSSSSPCKRCIDTPAEKAAYIVLNHRMALKGLQPLYKVV